MHLVAEIQNGFEARPALRTVLAQLDLTSACNQVEHTELLLVFQKLGMPPVCSHFHQGFLSGQSFRVRSGNGLSKWARESCGIPQGVVSSPILFLICMEDMLRTIIPAADAVQICIAMFADDVTIWKTGNDIGSVATDLSSFINNSLHPWPKGHNMKLSLCMKKKKTKCFSFLFSTHHHDPWPRVFVSGEVLPCPAQPKSSCEQLCM